jgi:hypothetical protein
MIPKRYAAILLAIFAAITVSGQSDRGALNGAVTDAGGAIVQGAKVTVMNLNTGESRETTTTAEGFFTFPELSANAYRLTVEAQGFKIAVVDSIQIGVQTTRRADVQLQAGDVSETVTISAGQAEL